MSEEIGYMLMGFGFCVNHVDDSLEVATLTNSVVHTNCVTEAIEIAKSITAFSAGETEENEIIRIYVKESNEVREDTFEFYADTVVSTITYNIKTKRWDIK